MTFRVRGGVLVVLVGALVLGPSLPSHSQADSPGEKLERAKDELADVRDRLEEVTDKCEANEEEVDKVNQRVEKGLEAVGEAEFAVAEQESIVDEAEQRLSDLETEAQGVQKVSSGRVAELYKRGLVDPTLHSLLMSSSTEQALSRAQVLNVVKRSDRLALEELTSSQTAVDGQRTYLQEQHETLESALDQRKELVEDLEDLRASYEKKIAKCTDKIVVLEEQERILEDDEAKLRAAVSSSAVALPAAVSADGWTWPAAGSVTSGFGMRWGRLHAGIDIGASSGDPIYAANDGVVTYAGSMSGYGNIVVVNHGGGVETRYAHQSAIGASTGQTVKAGERIGSVGCTGSCTGPHLHFEVRVNNSPQDPIGYLP